MDARSPERGTINETKTRAFKNIAKYIEKVCMRLGRSSLVAHFPRIPETQVTQQQSRKHKVWKYKFTLVDVKQGESACGEEGVRIKENRYRKLWRSCVCQCCAVINMPLPRHSEAEQSEVRCRAVRKGSSLVPQLVAPESGVEEQG